MKIIFLDVDGVLINRASFLPPLKVQGVRAGPDPACVEQLNRVVRETGAHIVLSSTWRYGLKAVECRELLFGWGVIALVIGPTPRLTKPKEFSGQMIEVSATRGSEIAKWLETEGERLDVDSFVILDDDSDMDGLTPRLVRTNFEPGLTQDDAGRAIEMLNVTPDQGL